MIKTIQKITIFISLVLLAYLGYQGFVKDNSVKWKNYPEPEFAAYMNLDEDERILKDLEDQTLYSKHKPLSGDNNSKPTIFQRITR